MTPQANSAQPQVFISYSHEDNARPRTSPVGWIDDFDQALAWELRQRGRKCTLWRDKRGLRPDQFFDDVIRSAVDGSVVFVAIVSPNYVESEYCLRELGQFVQGGPELARAEHIMKVVKYPVNRANPDDRLPEVLQRRVGFQFFRIDRESGEELLFWDAGTLKPQFYDTVRDVVRAIEIFLPDQDTSDRISRRLAREALTITGLQLARSNANSASPAKGADSRPVVYLADVSSDLEEAHRSVRGELENRLGAQVLPERQLPLDEAKAASEMDAALSASCVSVHLLGRRAGYVPDGPSGKSIVAQQLERAMNLGRTRPGFHRLIWVSPSLQDVDPRQKALLDVLRQEGGLSPSDHLVEESLERFKSHAVEFINQLQAPIPAARSASKPPVVFLVCSEKDEAQALELRQRFQSEGLEVRMPEFEGPAEHRAAAFDRHARRADGFLVMFSAETEAWVFDMLDSLGDWHALGRRNDFPCKGVLIAGTMSPRKQSFSSPRARTIIDSDLTGFIADLKRV